MNMDDSQALHDHAAAQMDLRIWLRLLASSTLIQKRLRHLLRTRFDSTLPRFDVLAQLERAPEGMSMGDLSSHLMVSAGNITGLVERLKREGLIERVPIASDRRRQHVRLTEKGHAAFNDMTLEHDRWIMEAFAALTKDEKKSLLAILQKLKTHLQETKP